MLVLALVLGAGVRELLFVIDFSPTTELPVQPATVRVTGADEVIRTREALLRYVFDAPALVTDRPVSLGDDRYSVPMGLDLASQIRMQRSPVPNGRLVLYHAGHAAFGEADQRVVDAFVEDGYDVLVFDMPLVGLNARPVTVNLPNGPVTVSRHDHMAYLDPMTPGSPVRYFIQPVVVMLNAFEDDYEDITMVGISGGGWTTTLAAALDPRIDRSYPIAGTQPLAVKFAREDAWGDWEQTVPSLYDIADYVDLYVLGAHDRRQMQVLNEFDPCCFSGDHRGVYERQVQAALEDSGGGSFEVFLDSNNREHSLSQAARDAIIRDMVAAPN